MKFINWGSESPEQLAIRRRLEQETIYEQAVRSVQAKNRAGNTPGAVGGGSVSTGNFYVEDGYIDDYFI